ncbi:OSCP/delta subunit of ATPase [Zopfochytrium polystomum]|nr:OSCP/delta subunit of ATPase [Zopfochytrium polystomum]
MNFQRTFSRTLATAAGAAPQIPITLHGIDGRYATALYSAAARKSSLETVETELKRIKGAIDKNPSLQAFLETPIADRAAKREGVRQILGSGKYSELVTNFFDVLAENGRLDQTSKVIASFDSLMTAHRGEVTVVVTSAKELDAKSLSRVRDSLQKSALIQKGQKLIVSNKVDSAILGGLIVEIGDKTIDFSVSSKVAKLDRLLKESI